MITHASSDERFSEHPGLKLYGIESYVAVPLLRRDGTYFGTLCALDPDPAPVIGDEHLEILALLASLIAFELEAAEEQERRDAELLEARHLALGRERLIGVLGHDLRSPLSAILAAASAVLRTPGLPEAAQRRTGYVVRSAERMGRLVGDLLDFTRGRLGGGIPIESGPADVAEIAGEAVDEARAAHPERSILVVAEGMTRGEWDEGRLAQVLTNLVENAVRYSPDDTPVQVRVHGHHHEVSVSVHNSGPPIPAHILPDIFDPFRRGAHEATSATRSGMGLGLYIVDRIVLAHGGRTNVQSTAEAGTTFTITLPRLPRAGASTNLPPSHDHVEVIDRGP